FRPQWLQVFNNSFWLLIILCYFSTIGTAFLGFKAVIAPILEKRYNMTSTEVGAIMSSADISAAINGILLTFYASQKHKGRWIGYSLLLYIVGTMLFVAPHFLVDDYYYLEDDSGKTLCHRSINTTSIDEKCSKSYEPSTFWICPFLFVLGQILCGAGNATRYNLSVAYLDENVSPIISPLYVGIIHMMSIIGPTLGYVIGGALTNVYVDWPKDPPNGLTSNSVAWVGAWWINYLGIVVLIALTVLFVFAFPRHLPSYYNTRQERIKEATVATQHMDYQYGNRMIDLPKAIKQLLSNKIFMFASFGITVDKVAINGLTMFLPQYIQAQTGYSLLVASMLGGGLISFIASVGQVAGGYVIKRWKLKGSQISRFCFFTSICNFLLGGVYLISCPNIPIAGVNIPYANITYKAACNSHCLCDSVPFEPVCGGDGISYLSPCHAGCSSLKESDFNNNLVYKNCTCVPSATPGFCQVPICQPLYALMIGITFSVIAAYISYSPTLTVILRNVPESQVSFALGVLGFMKRMIGGLLGPIFLGIVMDKACSLWNIECDHNQFCWQYDNRDMSKNMFITMIVFKGMQVIIYAVLWYFH
ncbi:uncharacterized protein TRIADDRAFT_11804, partial [Trichoplax adhaerens]